MNITESHSKMVKRLAKNGNTIGAQWAQDETVGSHLDLAHAALGLSGEIGEVVDLIKKTIINGRELDRSKLIEELGDVEFYMAMLHQWLGVDREQILAGNIEKLAKRYPDGYSDQAAKDRVDVAK